MKKKLCAVLALAVVASLAFAQFGPPQHEWPEEPPYGSRNQPPSRGRTEEPPPSYGRPGQPPSRGRAEEPPPSYDRRDQPPPSRDRRDQPPSRGRQEEPPPPSPPRDQPSPPRGRQEEPPPSPHRDQPPPPRGRAEPPLYDIPDYQPVPMGDSGGSGWMDIDTYLSFSLASPIQWYQSSGDREISAWTASVGAGLDLTSFITRRMGFHVSFDFYFPQTMNGRESEGGTSYAISSNLQDEWDSDWGISVFAGPSFALLRTQRILFALAPGFHYYMLFAEQGRDSVFQCAFGLGASAELMFNVTDFIFLRAAVDLTWDFWGIEKYLYGFWTDYSNINSAVTVTPSVGIGVKL